MKSSKYFKLFGNCILVKGVCESIICDLERCCYLPVSNKIFDVISTCEERGFSIDELKGFYENQFDEGIDELFKYIHNQGYGFFTNEPELFPKISLEWDSPYILTNAIVEIDNESIDISCEATKQLAQIGCHAVELRFLDEMEILTISNVVDLLSNSRTSCVFVLIKYSPTVTFEELIKIFAKHRIIGNIIVHSSPKSEDFKEHLPSSMYGKIKHIIKTIGKDDKELSGKPTMVINMPAFTEAYNFNLGLNRKVCINSKGEIKNYLTHEKVFGNIQNNKIKDVIKTSEFAEIWNVSKNRIEICRDCQYRYMCMDNSDIFENNGVYVKNINCNFNPSQNTWNS